MTEREPDHVPPLVVLAVLYLISVVVFDAVINGVES